MSPDVVNEGLRLSVDGAGSAPIKLFLLFTVLTFIPALVISMTSFTRIIIVLSFLRQALGTPQLPPNPVLIGLSLFLSFFVMSPTLNAVYDNALSPFVDDKMGWKEAAVNAEAPLATFMEHQVHEEDLQLFFGLAGLERPQTGEKIPLRVLVPAFLVSELTTAFTMGLYLFVPMLLIDLLVSGLLMALGMMMVPPTMIALPLKLGVFVLADGWHVLIGSLAQSFH